MPRIVFAVVLALGLSGCGASTSPASPESPNPAATTAAEFKDRLTNIADTGATGSAMAGLPELAKQQSDPSLVKDVEALQKATSPNQVKALAKKMLEKVK